MGALNFYHNPEAAARASEAEKRAFLAYEINVIDDWYKELGQYGSLLRRLFNATVSQEAARPLEGMDTAASYCPYELDGTFINRIHYNLGKFTSRADFFEKRAHEKIHAVETLELAARHATGLNRKTNIIIAPQDALKAYEMAEILAWTGSKFIRILFKTIRERSVGPGYDISFYADILRNMAPNIMKMKAPNGKTLERDYRDLFFSNYGLGIAKRREEIRDRAITFVRLDDQDHIDAGNLIGVNPFTGDDGKLLSQYQGMPTLSLSERWRMHWFSVHCDTRDRAALPTLREALAAKGLTPKEFIALSRSKPAATPAPKPLKALP